MSNLQPLVDEHPILVSNEIHIVEEDSINEEDSPANELCLEDALDAWQEISSLVRKIGRSLMKREVKTLKRSAHEIAQRYSSESIPEGEQQRDDSTTSTPEGVFNKRRRVFGFEEDGAKQKSVLQEDEKESLLGKFARMKRMHAVLLNLNNSHRLMEQEIRDMIDQESREESY
jgi:hypothetical protein